MAELEKHSLVYSLPGNPPGVRLTVDFFVHPEAICRMEMRWHDGSLCEHLQIGDSRIILPVHHWHSLQRGREVWAILIREGWGRP